MGRRRLYNVGTRVIFTQHNPAIQKVAVGRKDGQCKYCGIVLRKSALSLHVPVCRKEHNNIRML